MSPRPASLDWPLQIRAEKNARYFRANVRFRTAQNRRKRQLGIPRTMSSILLEQKGFEMNRNRHWARPNFKAAQLLFTVAAAFGLYVTHLGTASAEKFDVTDAQSPKPICMATSPVQRGTSCARLGVGVSHCQSPFVQLAQGCIQPVCGPGTVPCGVTVQSSGCLSWSCCQQ